MGAAVQGDKHSAGRMRRPAGDHAGRA